MGKDTGPLELSSRPKNPLEAISNGLGRQSRSLKRFVVSKPLGAAGGLVVLIIVFGAIFAPLVAPFDPYEFNLDENGMPVRLEGPGADYLIGTDAI